MYYENSEQLGKYSMQVMLIHRSLKCQNLKKEKRWIEILKIFKLKKHIVENLQADSTGSKFFFFQKIVLGKWNYLIDEVEHYNFTSLHPQTEKEQTWT